MNRDQSLPARPAPIDIPVSIRIGVTGHRKLVNTELIRHSVDLAVDRLDAMLGAAPHCYTVLSPLAEGADRLVAKQVLAWPAQAPDLASDLTVVLPLAVEEYLKDFLTKDSRAEFVALLERANFVRAIPTTESRPAAYLRAGQAVVQGCDVLIAIWNGRPAAGEGGTAQIVDFARQVGRWMFWIHAEDGTISEENAPGTLEATLTSLSICNQERLSQGSSTGNTTATTSVTATLRSQALGWPAGTPMDENRE